MAASEAWYVPFQPKHWNHESSHVLHEHMIGLPDENH